MCRKHNLNDIWRIYNPSKNKFTWSQGISNKQARLDHAPISLIIELDKHARGPGTWKFNNSLLLEESFIKTIKEEIIHFEAIYAATPYNPNYISVMSHGFDLMITPSLFWETLLVTLRGIIIRYSRQRKRTKNADKKKTEEKILELICLPKTGKARNLIKNWRPISLLNTTYKLISLCITNRIRPLLPKLISPEQKGFMSGRSISDCTRLMFDLVYECQQQNIEGLIVLVDFEKAFDSLFRDFILKTLKNLSGMVEPTRD